MTSCDRVKNYFFFVRDRHNSSTIFIEPTISFHTKTREVISLLRGDFSICKENKSKTDKTIESEGLGNL